MRGAIRRPCRRQGTACQTQGQKIRMPISICRSQTPQKSPQRTCAFRPAALKRPWSWFYDFAKTIASAEQEAIKLLTLDLVTNMHQKCKLVTASFMLFLFQFIFCITFFQKCCSRSCGETIFANRLQVILIKDFIFLTPERRPKDDFL